MKRPPIFHQPEKSYHCGACSTATVLSIFGETPPPIPILYADLKGEEANNRSTDGMWSDSIQSYFLRRDWACIVGQSGGPKEFERDADGDYRAIGSHTKVHQRVATWRIVHQMLKDGWACILEWRTPSGPNHFAVVYDAFIRRNVYWFRLACSAQGYYSAPAETLLDNTGYRQIFVKPHRTEYR